MRVAFFCVTYVASDPVVVEKTIMEVELKGDCVQYDVVIEPSVLLVPGLILQDTVTRRNFKVTHPCSSILYHLRIQLVS